MQDRYHTGFSGVYAPASLKREFHGCFHNVSQGFSGVYAPASLKPGLR